MNYWILILGMALVTYVQRLFPLTRLKEGEMPGWARRGLAYVPVAVLSALIGAAFIPAEGWFDFIIDGRTLAGLVAIGLARLTGNALVTLAGGMVVLWIGV